MAAKFYFTFLIRVCNPTPEPAISIKSVLKAKEGLLALIVRSCILVIGVLPSSKGFLEKEIFPDSLSWTTNLPSLRTAYSFSPSFLFNWANALSCFSLLYLILFNLYS